MIIVDMDPNSILCRMRCNCPSLKKADFSHKQLRLLEITILANILTRNTHLTSLNLSHNAIDDAGALVLRDMLQVNTSLEELQLEGNSIGDVGARALGKVMEKKPILLSLIRGFILIGGSDVICQVLRPLVTDRDRS